MEYTHYIHRAFVFRQFRKQGQCIQNPDSPANEIKKQNTLLIRAMRSTFGHQILYIIESILYILL